MKKVEFFGCQSLAGKLDLLNDCKVYRFRIFSKRANQYFGFLYILDFHTSYPKGY